MKVLIYEQNDARFQLLSEAVMKSGMEVEPGETLEQLSHDQVVAAIVSQELSDWTEVFNAAMELKLPIYVAGRPEMETLSLIKRMGRGTQTGIISTFDEGLVVNQTISHLQRLKPMPKQAAPGRQTLLRRPTVIKAPANPDIGTIPKRPLGISPSPELQARRVRKKKNTDTIRDQIICVYSPKGGVGKSTFSTNLAYSLATCTNLQARVILVDLDVSFGNVASILNLPNKANLLNWIRGDFKENLSDLVYVHEESGLHVLMSPPNPVDAGDINYHVVDKMLSILSKRYDFIIIDTNPALRALHKACFEWSDNIVLITTPQKPTLRDCKLVENIFRQLQIPLEKVKLVVNQVPKKQSLRIKDALQEMNYETLGFIPDDPYVRTMENLGTVACLSAKCKDYARAHYDICNKLLGKTVMEQPTKFKGLDLFTFFKKRVSL